MKLFYSYNQHFVDMLYQFKSSFKDEWEIYENKIEDFKEKNVMAGGKEGDRMRRNLINLAFENTKENEIFVVSDIDIIFYKPCIQLVLNQFNNKQRVFIDGFIQEKEIDFCIQKENCIDGKVNMGFMAIKNNKKSKVFFREVYDICLPNNTWDQPTLNEVLHKNLKPHVKYAKYSPKDENNIAHYINSDNLIWDTFPTEIWNRSIGLEYISKNIHLHHANCAVTKDEKNYQFNYIKNLLNI